MGEAFWAAREGDALLHTSFAADFLSGALEIAANLAIAAAAAAVVVYGGAIIGAVIAGTSAIAAVGAVATVGVSATLGCSGMFAVGALTGALMSVSGLGETITKYADKFANWVFPPTIQGYILTGSEDTRTNSKPSARAAATALPRQLLEEIEKRSKEAEEAEKKRQEAQSISDIAAEYFESAKKTVQGLGEKLSTFEGAKELSSDMLDSAGNLISEIWQPTVARAAPGSEPRDKDKVDCHKHPSSLTDFARHKADRGLLGGILDAINPLGALETSFQAVNGLIGSIKGWCGQDSAEYLAEGARDVRINSQPAARSNARTTCEAKVAKDPEKGKHVSGDVLIGGPLLVVRDIKSGKSQVVLVASLVMAFMQPGKFASKLGCFLFGFGTDMLVQKAINAILSPVNAATGAKYLAGKEDLDFVLPGHFPVDWQRTYSSRDERTEGMFGPGWSVPCEVSLERTPDNPDEHCWTFISNLGRRLDMQAVAPGQGFHSAGEGLAVRRSAEGIWLITDDDGTHYLFEPDPHDSRRQRLHQMGDRHQHSHTLHYDQAGRLRLLTDEEQRNGLIFHYEHPEHARRVSRIERRLPDDTYETLMHYGFNKCGELTDVRNSQHDLLRQFAYDDHHNMTMHRLPEGDVCHYRWAWYEGPDDDAWRVTEHWTDSGEHYRLDWHLPERRLCVSDSLGRLRHHHWNARGQITRYQDELGHISHFQWSEDRLLLGMTDAQDGQWRYVYDRQGHLTETHDPLGRTEQTQWHEVWHKPLLEVNAAGHTWQHLYDERGNLIATRDPHQQQTLYHYNGHGLITKITDPRGGHNHFRWNEDGQLIRHTDCSGYDTAWFYDTRGQLRQSTNAAGESTVWHYNSAGQLISTLYPDGRRERYDVNPAGLLTGITDPTGRITRYRRDARGRITSRTDAAGRSLSVHYDPYGRMTSLANENGECYKFQYDDKDRLTEQTGLDGCRQQRSYDPLDNVTAVRFAAGTADQIEHSFTRDAMGRLTEKRTTSGCTTYRYDKTDNLLEVAFRKKKPDSAGGEYDDTPETIAFSYDRLGQLLTETTSQGTLKHDHDELGNITRTTLPDGQELKHHYYGSGHLSQINLDGGTVCEFERDRLHREILRTQGRLDTRRHFDSAGRIHRIQTSHGKNGIVPNTVIDRHYQYDNLDQLITRRHSRQGRADYHYDATGRITRCHHEHYRDTLHYDAAANLLDESADAYHDDPPPGTLQGNVVRFNRLMHFRRHHYQYDAHGRMQSKRSPGQTLRCHYSTEHRLIKADVTQGQHTRSYGYVYDALGRRVEKHQLDSQGNIFNRITFLWDGLRMVQETRPEGSQSLWLYADQGSYEPLARVDKAGGVQGNILYFHTGLNGAPEELTDTEGNVVWETHYQIWGNTVREVYAETEHTPVEQNLRYQGQYLDRETGLHYNTFRYYDPDVGRFTTSDPIGLRGGLNLYQYAPNPLSWIDPLGLTGEWVNPKDINFSQRTISPHDYADIMSNNGWDWNRSPLRVIEIDGQLVSYDNRRLDAALEAGLDKVKVIRVDPNAPHPDSSTGKTWLQKFQQRFRDKRNIQAGGIVPDTGLSTRPKKTSKGCK